MRARVPLDVDLEDRLLYGLTPIRLAYVVLALLGAFAAWSLDWMPAYVRAPLAIMAAALGAVLAWGRWRGRAADSWMADFGRYVLGSHRIRWIRRT